MMATTTTPVAVVVAQQTKEIARLFPAAVYGGREARALDALAALDACVRADVLRGPVAPESALQRSALLSRPFKVLSGRLHKWLNAELRQARMHLNGRLCIRDGSDAADRHSRRWTPTPPIPTRGEALNTQPAAAPRVPRVGVSKIMNMWRAHQSESFLF
jgi:hypothetical protein